MTTYTFEIPGTPVPKARPRAFSQGGHIRMYTPTASKNFEYLVRTTANREIPSPLEGAVSVDIVFLLPRPKNMFWKTKPMPRTYHTKRFDLDNLLKSCFDGMNSIAYHDDKQIAVIHARKYICSGTESPKTIINIKQIQ